jgi:hypothetical protein
VPLRLITFAGFVMFTSTLGLAAWVLWVRVLTDRAVPGWASTVLPLYFLGGIQLLCLGIVGEYLAKIYVEVKRRPRYLIEKLAGHTGTSDVAASGGAFLGEADPASRTP